MVADHPTVAEPISNSLIDFLSQISGICEVWITSDRDTSIFWVITDSLSNDGERAFYQATNILYDLYPNARCDLRLLNPVYFPPEYDLRQAVPSRAVLVKSFRCE